ncbi:hypothetical protein Q9295_03155 [Xinfangfangia sp. CPCC 101601]|uniref:Tetratricopeptide repeat protein n=1 Tax=Pseudogemmobacter lacusdianii TaxID=3069608 RepID=A0ABU0VUF1_9RHOB|nr:tetratricopeptide repeat protein [Xinfangfangia sp. CPCC 101601]MDQ2065360.1 hypothetical protein [Xinfangfangia sp. CPCC 101601]
MLKRASALIKMAFLAVLLSGCVASTSGGGAGQDETVQVAEAAYSVGDYVESARLFELAATRHPNSVTALIGLGKSYAALGQFSRANNALMRASALGGRHPEVHNQLGNLALLELHPKQAIEHFDRALTLDRKNLAGLTGKAVSLDYLSRHAEAQDVYRSALQSYPTNFALLSNFALSQVLSGSIGQGTKLMEELLRDPSHGSTARANLAIAYALDGRERDARALLSGLMSDAEVAEALRHYARVRKEYLAGKPVGYLIFQ